MASAFLDLYRQETISKGRVVAKTDCECKVCKTKGLKCSECPKCSTEAVAKGVYSESIEGIQRDRQKANRRRSAGNAFLGGSALVGAAALANRDVTRKVTAQAGTKIGQQSLKTYVSSGDGMAGNVTRRAAQQGLNLGTALRAHPGRAAAGIIGGAALAGAGLKGAGMAHNARSNRNARKYNRRKENSRIKIVPTSGKNRF